MMETDKKKGILYFALLTIKNSKGVKLSRRNFNIVLAADCYSLCLAMSSRDCLLLCILVRATLSLSASLRESRLRKVIMEMAGTSAWQRSNIELYEYNIFVISITKQIINQDQLLNKDNNRKATSSEDGDGNTYCLLLTNQ